MLEIMFENRIFGLDVSIAVAAMAQLSMFRLYGKRKSTIFTCMLK